MSSLHLTVRVAGFRTRCQLAGWRELKGARGVAIYNRPPAKAEVIAREFGPTFVKGQDYANPMV